MKAHKIYIVRLVVGFSLISMILGGLIYLGYKRERQQKIRSLTQMKTELSKHTSLKQEEVLDGILEEWRSYIKGYKKDANKSNAKNAKKGPAEKFALALEKYNIGNLKGAQQIFGQLGLQGYVDFISLLSSSNLSKLDATINYSGESYFGLEEDQVNKAKRQGQRVKLLSQFLQLNPQEEDNSLTQFSKAHPQLALSGNELYFLLKNRKDIYANKAMLKSVCNYSVKVPTVALLKQCASTLAAFIEFKPAAQIQKILVQMVPSLENQETYGYYLVQGEFYIEAILLFQSLIAQGKQSFNVYLYLGQAYFFQKEYEAAILASMKAKAIDPNSAQIHNNIGVCHLTQGDYLLARPFFEKAVELNPKYKKALLRLAKVYQELGQAQKYSQTMATLNKL